MQTSINKIKKDRFLFNLVICDEAHRTTGVTVLGKEDADFVKVHEDKYIKAKKRIYMTATPRIYSEAAQTKAREASAEVCSMDDPEKYGEEIYRIGFGEAVDKQLLSDYKVIVLTIEEDQLSEKLAKSIKDKNAEIKTDDALKIIGCINALSKKSLTDKELFEGVDPAPMRSAVAFCQNIAVSKDTVLDFNACRDAYFETLAEEKRSEMVVVDADHVDGTMGAQIREQKLHWLKSADPAKQECKILHNVRCLSEGVDVPSLDAVMFLSARNSQIDVVQSVGRVMRRAEGKKYGYIIIPVVVQSDADPEKTLASDRFNVVWTVLNALRAHDDRFNATINKIELNKKKSTGHKGKGGGISVTGAEIGGGAVDDDGDTGGSSLTKSKIEKQLELEFAKLQGQIYAKIVQKCGTKPYWEQWAKDVAAIAEHHIESITEIVKKKGNAKDEFEKYLTGLRKNINPAVTEQEAIEMLAQHIITQPVFDALFEDYSFAKNNTVSQSLQGIIDALNEKQKKDDTEKLDKFYVSVQQRASDIDNSEAKQKIIVELYDKFFRTAFPKVTEKLGIVYTPVEVVDFIIHSVEDVLQKEFGRSMSDENVHILDPFTGTGTFITRLLQSGIIKNEDLKRKYTKEIHANEIILLAYYIASINIENVYHDLAGRGKWKVESGGNNHADLHEIAGMAGSYESGGDDLQANEKISERGDVFADESDSAGGSVNSGEHSGRKREANKEGISTLSVHSKRFPLRTGDSPDYCGTSKVYQNGRNDGYTETNGYSRTYADSFDEVAEKKVEYGVGGMESKELSVESRENDLLPTFHSPLSTLSSPLSIPYTPFPGICLTDTFQLGETKEGEVLFSEIFPQNSERVQMQQNTPLRVIFGNPPYSIGQRSANDNAQNQQYLKLESRIQNTYVFDSTATLARGLYDSYVKAFRWASDRIDIDTGGIVAFITNSGWIDKGGFDGLRKHFEKEFSAIYILNLRGAIKGKSGEAAKREGQNVFDIMTGVAITLLIKKHSVNDNKAMIHYYDIGDYLNRKDKFTFLTNNKSFINIKLNKQILTPNDHGDWINKRNSKYAEFIQIEPIKKFDRQTQSFFSTYAIGAATNRDVWVYNFSKNLLKNNMNKMINFYNEQRRQIENERKKNKNVDIIKYINPNPQKISWTRSLRNDIEKNIIHKFKNEEIIIGLHRPFSKEYLYYDRPFIESPGIWPQLIPSIYTSNLFICVSGLNTRLDNTSVLITNIITDLNILDAGTQCFPLYWYEKKDKAQSGLFEQVEDEYIRHDAISDFILEQAKSRYGLKITKKDIFYYVYGLLHSPDYRTTFANDLKKMLPRLPLVEKPADFWAFSKAGKELGDLHIDYEKYEPPKEILINGKPVPKKPFPEGQLAVNKMSFPSKSKKDTIIYNSWLTISNIPEKAYEYVVNGKSAIEWVMERYAVTTHKESGIKNDPNDWAMEHENPQYILDLLLSVITVSMKTVDIVAGLPKVEWG
ncbi:MAG: DEAD/DEAH box helicase family protein [Treponema sp.]|nr:DEAD/DEAH box helicase family protein [Treponema sp.]